MVEVVRNKRNNRILIGIIIFAFIALLVVTIAVIAISANDSRKSGNSQSTTTSDDSSDGGDNGQSSSNSSSTSPDDDSDEETDDNEITGSIDYRGLVGDTLRIQTTIDGSYSDGTCVLTLNGPNEQSYTSTVRMMSISSSSSTCNGFDINMDAVEDDDELRSGKWTITIDLSSGGKTGQLTDEMSL